MGKVLFFILFIIIVITIAWYDSFTDRDRAFDYAFGGFIGDFGRYSDNFVDTSL